MVNGQEMEFECVPQITNGLKFIATSEHSSLLWFEICQPWCHFICLSNCLLVNFVKIVSFQDLKFDPNDDFLSALRAIIRCMNCPEKYFEKVIRLAINKMGTDEGALTRVITTRAEVDMKAIKDEYQRRNSVPLDSAIVKDTTGDYEDFLLALIGHESA